MPHRLVTHALSVSLILALSVASAGGNAAPYTEAGWSSPEPDFTWSVGPRSLLRPPMPREAPNYRLTFDAVPFVAANLPAQRLEIVVNGTTVAVFDPLPAGESSCDIPGALVNGEPTLEIVFLHPRAASPRDLGIGDDERMRHDRFPPG